MVCCSSLTSSFEPPKEKPHDGMGAARTVAPEPVEDFEPVERVAGGECGDFNALLGSFLEASITDPVFASVREQLAH